MSKPQPRTFEQWMARIEARLEAERRHTHASATGSGGDLEGRVAALESEYAALSGTVAALEATTANQQSDLVTLFGAVQELQDDVFDLQAAVTAATAFTPFAAYAPAVANWTAQAAQGWLRFGRMVQLTIFTARSSSDQSSAFTYGTLPVGARPVAELYFPLYNSTSGATGQDRRCHIATTGVVTIHGTADTVVTAGNSLAGSVTYIGPA